ncbi:hypothetical protein QQ045_019828 [Rhodiola kirilowii]
MELLENEFNITNGNNHLYLHQLSCIQAPLPHPYLPTSFHHSFTTPSAQLCHKKSEKSGGRKRKRSNGEGGASEGLKPSDVVHVRVKRGQATDSHSLAERVRRKKINEKLQSLNDIVPGCHKTMGMAVMLDVVIKYIQSLQNQIEFLSMKLQAASLFHDLTSSDMDAVETMQVRSPQTRPFELFLTELQRFF